MYVDKSGTDALGIHVSAFLATWYAHSVSQLQRHLAYWANDGPPRLSRIVIYNFSSEHTRIGISGQMRINRSLWPTLYLPIYLNKHMSSSGRTSKV
jgi:hypothetical protein